MQALKIAPEFRDKIPPLSEAEYTQLKENILADGEVYEPIVTWNDTIIDGHNRWKIICENWEVLHDKYRVKQIEFSDKWEAFEWMYRKQLGRRNLTQEQKTYMIGKMYEARKKSVGNTTNARNADGTFKLVQSEPLGSNPKSTAEVIGREVGVAGPTVKRAEHFARGIDALKKESPEAAQKVLKGGSGASRSEIADLKDKESGSIAKMAQDILSGEIKKKPANSRGWTREDRETRAKTEAIIADMYDPTTVPEFTIDFLEEDIVENGKEYVKMLKNTLTDRSNLLTPENRPRVSAAIDTIISEIQKLKGLI